MIQDSEEQNDNQNMNIKDIGTEEPSSGQNSDIELALKEVDRYKDLAHRTAAELENLKKRSLQERDEIRKYGQSQLVIKMLGVLDDFNRAMDIFTHSCENLGNPHEDSDVVVVTTRMHNTINF